MRTETELVVSSPVPCRLHQRPPWLLVTSLSGLATILTRAPSYSEFHTPRLPLASSCGRPSVPAAVQEQRESAV
ncbi:hypothetical protein PR202_gb25044 [Eleusine coracana subsp. coracana]|uniref:Uncharacterized protein n=1 Tax=Eleusine coracana subsp. coracana TaxID=191504 RepID=A0AAV5FKB4_ELECO|nr:hypothetical protein PR202_gb25044 [Eleusine coracana subsp. coracana]